MKISRAQHNQLVADGHLYSINGRWYIALDSIEAGELASSDAGSASMVVAPEPMPEAEPAPELSALKERRRERKADVEGSAGSS